MPKPSFIACIDKRIPLISIYLGTRKKLQTSLRLAVSANPERAYLRDTLREATKPRRSKTLGS